MSLSISSRPERNLHVLTITGHLTLGPTLKTLQQTARTALDSGAPDGLILDVTGIRYADSAGLGELTIVYTMCTRRRCGLILMGVPHQLRHLLELTRLDALLPSAPDIDTARRRMKELVSKLRGQDAAAAT